MASDNITNKNNLPKHVSVIMDGNRRWAKKRGLPAMEGHRKGANNFEKLVNEAKKMGIKCVSAWAFSTENWKRSKEEVDFLFSLIRKMSDKYEKKCIDEKIRFVQLGRKDRIPADVRDSLTDTEEKTKNFTDFTIALGIDYGGHDELIRTMKKLSDQKLEITPENIEKNLDTACLPQIDLIIRTGGEKRLSGFMPWQSEYAELYFTDVFFPAFGRKELAKALEWFSQRERRFGGDSTKSNPC